MSEIEFAGVSANPCPFCGGNNLAWETVEHNQMLMWSVVCRGADCFAQGPIDLGKSGAISKWNVLDALLAENALLRKQLDEAIKVIKAFSDHDDYIGRKTVMQVADELLERVKIGGLK